MKVEESGGVGQVGMDRSIGMMRMRPQRPRGHHQRAPPSEPMPLEEAAKLVRELLFLFDQMVE